MKRLRIAALGAMSFAVLNGTANAAPMSLSDAIRYALVHSVNVTRQQAVVAQDRATYVKQRAQTLPALNATAQNYLSKSQNYGGTFSLIGAQQANVFTQNTEQLQSNYTFYSGGTTRLQADLAKQQLDQDESEYRRIRNQVTTDVSNGYFTIAQRDEAVRLNRSDVDYQRALVGIAQAKVKAGVAAGVDVLRAQVQQAKSTSTLVASQADAKNARESLAQTIGAPLDTEFAVVSQVPQPPPPGQPVDELITLAQTHRAEVITASDALAAARTNRRTLNTDLYPNIQMNAGFGNQFSPTLAVQQQAAIDEQFAAENAARIAAGLPPLPLSDKPTVGRGSPGFWTISAISTWQLPLYDWGQRKAMRTSFDRQIDSAQNVLDNAKSQVALDVRQNYRSAQTALAQLVYANEEVRLGRESARVARLQYQAGIIALSDVLQTQRDALTADTDYYNARVAYVEALVKLRLATGLFDGESA
ncbi:MAG: TolC family protein, partial [Candidatus Eremiobacteraeota bacterium]|nr:TolC family protein [Candidatus Eremiobacteraeota bacterium]